MLVPHRSLTLARVALLVNFIPPYRVPLFEALQARVGELKIFVSTPLEPNRSWNVHWGSLQVVVQRSLAVRKRWRNLSGFTDIGFVHFPYDTLAQLRRFRPDVVISSELGLRTALAAIYKLRHPRVRFIVWATVSEHTESNRGLIRTLLRPRLLHSADAVLVNGASGARYVTGFGVQKHRIVVAPYTTDVAAFQKTFPRPATPGRIRLLFAGMLVERKGLVPFLNVLGKWCEEHPDQRVEFIIAGEGPLRSELQRRQNPSNLDVCVLNAVPYDQLPALYRTADIFVLPTLADEWGVVVNEAMAAGLPVLGSRYSQAVEELVNSETGWSFEPGSIDTVYDAVNRAFGSHPDEWRRMGAIARRRVVKLAPEHVADRILETCA
jgi:glycosyltransferase involved in cell wall biosynthesis